MKRLMIAMTVVLAATTLLAAGGTRKRAVKAEEGNDDGPVTQGKEAQVTIRQYPKLGRQATLDAPFLAGGTCIGQVYKKPRKWIVLEAEYQTVAKTLEQLTFTWHVVLDTKTATNKDRENQAKIAPYSYFTTTVTYHNIPRGSHAASVCLHPSYLECYGEPKAVGIVITNQNGEELGGDTLSEIKQIPKGSKFWEDAKVMNAPWKGDINWVERRQGLQDRSKTIWALVNPNDYELTLQ